MKFELWLVHLIAIPLPVPSSTPFSNHGLEPDAVLTAYTIRSRILVQSCAFFTPSAIFLRFPSTRSRREGERERRTISRKLGSSKFDGRVVTLDAFNISEYAAFHGTPCRVLATSRETYIRDLWPRLSPLPGPDKFTSVNFLPVPTNNPTRSSSTTRARVRDITVKY